MAVHLHRNAPAERRCISAAQRPARRTASYDRYVLFCQVIFYKKSRKPVDIKSEIVYYVIVVLTLILFDLY